jgi:hypothetical protein
MQPLSAIVALFLLVTATTLSPTVVQAKNPLVPPDFNLTQHYARHRRPLAPKHEHTPWCTNGMHTHGKWVFNQSLPRTFPCCGWDGHDHLWNTTLCGTTGMLDHWVSGIVSGNAYIQLGGHACWCDASGDRWKTNPIQQYTWTPAYCDLVDFDAKYFCELLGPRRILFVGDSTFSQTGATLMNLVRGQGGMCLGNILSAHVNHLWDFAPDWKMDWIDHIEYHDPQIVVFGFGAHDYSAQQFTTDWTKAMDMYQNFLHRRTKLIADRLLSSLPIQLVFKTQNPGHIHCDTYKAPVSTPPYIDRNKEDVYMWGQFDLFDKLGKEYAYRGGMGVLDMFPLALRPDGHPGGIDCLHYCAPGPMDVVGTLLLTMLHTGEL